MLKLFIGGVIMTAIFGCFIVPNHFYYNVALLNFGFLFTGFMIGLIFYREFETVDIDDSDLGSKSTFSLLTQIYALQSGAIKSTDPVLTIGVGS